MPETPAQQLKDMLAKFDPKVSRCATAALTKIRKLVPGATELVYDNYNALAIGFAPGEKSSEGVFSIALYPRWVSFFFLQGRGLSDPHRILQGKGNTVAHIVLESAATLDRPEVRELIHEALLNAKAPIDPQQKRRLIIKSISPKQRPRRPS